MILFTKQTQKLRKQIYSYQRGRWRAGVRGGGEQHGETDWESRIDMHTVPFKTDKQQGPTV